MIRALAVAASLGACSSDAPQTDQPTEERQAEQGSPAKEAPEPEESTPIADDDVVNGFITAYNSISNNPIAEVESDNIRTKFFGYSYDYHLELLHANGTGKIVITINATSENAPAGVAGIRDVFCDTVCAIDPFVTADQASVFLDSLLSDSVIAGNQQLGSMVVNFSPDAELNNGSSRGHIKVCAQQPLSAL